jgi:cell division protein FtsI/penicillin-binding protein 2
VSVLSGVAGEHRLGGEPSRGDAPGHPAASKTGTARSWARLSKSKNWLWALATLSA